MFLSFSIVLYQSQSNFNSLNTVSLAYRYESASFTIHLPGLLATTMTQEPLELKFFLINLAPILFILVMVPLMLLFHLFLMLQTIFIGLVPCLELLEERSCLSLLMERYH